MSYNKELLELVKIAKIKKNLGNYSPKKRNRLGILLYRETDFLPKDFCMRQRLYYVENDLKNLVKCKSCNNIPSWENKGPNKYSYKKYCSKCVFKSMEISEKFKQTNLKKYGVEFPSQSKYIKNKSKQTCLEKYGVEHTFQVQKFRDLGKKTKLEKYGDENYLNKEKFKRTNLERYGVEFPSQSKEVQRKMKLNNLLDKDLLIERFNKVHNNIYDYSKFDQYDGLQKVINIICPKHGLFRQRPDNHLRGSGCPKCANSGFSKKAIEWLNYISKTKSLYIQHAMNKGEYQIPGTRYYVDGYCSEMNTCYEFLGDKFHGNLKLFEKSQVVHPYKNISVKECYDQTISRLEEIKSLGYNIEYIWENDFNKKTWQEKI